jgi:hypothetical protein
LEQYKTLIYVDIIDRFESIRTRFLVELGNLKRRGNVNLVLGMFVSCIGILFLGWATLSLSRVSPEPTVIAGYFLPRLSFVVLIEIVAFFFLNLYKSNMIDIKYFQNELTNIEARLVSVQAAMMSGADDLVSAVVQVMATTERNFRLGRGESTVEIERERIGQDATARAMEKFMAMARGGSKGDT